MGGACCDGGELGGSGLDREVVVCAEEEEGDDEYDDDGAFAGAEFEAGEERD